MLNGKSMRAAIFVALTLAAPAMTARAGDVPIVTATQICGALLRDDFADPTHSAQLWRFESFDEGIRVAVEDGELVIAGQGHPYTEEEQLFPGSSLIQHGAGVWSSMFPQTDVALAVRVKIPTGIPDLPGSHVVNIHLCGVYPDCYPEALFGKLESAHTIDLLRRSGYAAWESLEWHDRLGWWFSVVQGTPTWEPVGEAVGPWGDEGQVFHDVLVEYDAPTAMARAAIEREGRWIPLGHERHVTRGATMAELKIVNMTTETEFHREARFDDCRLYMNPKRHPVRVALVSGALPHAGAPLRIGLYEQDAATPVSEGVTDSEGFALLEVDHPAWVAFPVAAWLRVFDGATEVARARIDADGIEGLYPGDVWILDTVHFAPRD